MGNNRFDQMALTWDEDPIRIRMAQAVTMKIMARINLNTAMNALEIGCGTGLVTVQLAPMLGQITALDSSDKMLAELHQKIKSLSIQNIRTQTIDLEKDDIPGNTYDFIYSNMAFHHINDGDRLLKKIYDALSSGGVLAISDLDTEDGSFHGQMPGVHHLGFSRVALVSSFEQAGFHHCSIEDAHVVEKSNDHGVTKRYPLFLITGIKM